MKTAHKKKGVPARFLPLPAPAPTPTERKNSRRRTRERAALPPTVDDAPYDLPQLSTDVVLRIFTHLDFKELGQVCLLAKPYRDCYKMARQLEFDQPFFRKLGRKGNYVSTVDHFIDQHCGPAIQSLKLSFGPDNNEGHWGIVTGWINKAIEKGIEEFDFDFDQAKQAFLLSDDIFGIKTLQILRLAFCEFIVPNPGFKITGLQLLRVCTFRNMNLEDMTILEALLQACLLLQTLELFHCCTLRYFKIAAGHLKRFKEFRFAACPNIVEVIVDAPTMTTFHYYGPVVLFKYGDIEKLTDVILDFKNHRTFWLLEHYQLDKVMYDMSNIVVLTTTSRLLEGLCPKYSDGCSVKTFFCLSKLKEVHLTMEGARYCNIFTIASFLRKCPSVEKLHIDVRGWFRLDRLASNKTAMSWVNHQLHQLYRGPGPCYPNLKQLKLTGFKFDPHEMQVLYYFLETAFNLETAVIFISCPRSLRGRFLPQVDEVALNRYLQSRKASPGVWVSVFEHYQEEMLFPSTHHRDWHRM